MKNIGLCITGSFCTFKRLMPEIKNIMENGYNVFPIFSFNVTQMDTRFYLAKEFYEDITTLTGNAPITTISEAEPIGPKKKLDLIIIAPCTGNTLAKLNHAITDTPVLMAAKAHLRNNKPVLVAVSTNDGLAANAKNIGELMNKKNIYFVPFSQDNYIDKTNSLVAHYEMLNEAIEQTLSGKQIQPILRGI
ncbi:MAG TPA: dipicolinate synthase subunit B [Clostridia bacterium]|nr:dipicolinate synthase subunit B [Clostridia bacterium]